MKALLPFSSLCCFGSFALAQKTVIQGQITDKSKTPLVGANKLRSPAVGSILIPS